MTKKVVLLLLLVAIVLPSLTFAQGDDVKISGMVLDDKTKEPVFGASVALVGSKKGVISGLDGSFSISAKSLPVTIAIAYLGYLRTEIEVYGAEEPIVVFLKENAFALGEAIAIGYSNVKKPDYSGSVAVVGPKELGRLHITTTGKALQGAIPGLQSIASAGQPGSDAALFIRGIGSVNASSSPLYVVDGVAGVEPNQINGTDIETISVLKDATASALYGSRGANGVIVITTKRGSFEMKPTVNLSVNYGYTGRAVKDYEYLSQQEYYELQWEAIRNTQIDQGKSATEAAQYATNYVVDGALKVNIYGPQFPKPVGLDGKVVDGAVSLWNDNWGKSISRTGVRQQYNLNVSGGSVNTHYFFSGGYIGEDGWIKASEYERFNIRSKIETKVNNWFKAGVNLSLSSAYQKAPPQTDSQMGNYVNFQRMISDIYPVYERNPDGTYALDENGQRQLDYGVWRPSTANSGYNILGNAKHNIFGNQTDAVFLGTNFTITFIKDLLLKTSVGVDYSAETSHSYSHSYYSTGVITEGSGTASRSSNRELKYTVNSFLDYTLKLDGGAHSFNLFAGPEVYVRNLSSLDGNRTGFQILGKTEPSVGSTIGGFNGTSSDYHLSSFLSKLDYDLLHRYHFSASFRRDGSSRFSKQARWGNFWSVGGVWNLKKESFMQDFKKINDLNVRISYGAQGNDNIGDYAYGGFYSIYNSLNVLGLLPSDLPTPDLKWETNLNFNVGFDVALFDERLTAQIDIFNRQSIDLLFTKPLAPSSGYSGINANIGSLSNRGIDGQIRAVPIINRYFQWDVTLNFGHYTNRITKLPQKEIINGNYKMEEGSSIYDFYIKEWAGVNPETGKAMWYKDIVDANGNVTGKETTESPNEASLGLRGSSLPDLYGGITNTFAYKDFELSFMFAYNIGGKVYDGDYVWIMHSGSAPGRNWSSEALTRWTPENPNTDFPRLSYVTDAWNTTVSTRFLYDATFARLRNLHLSYSLPNKLVSAWKLSGVSVNFTGENLLTFYAHKGFDPEQTVSGATYYRYPAQKAYSLGIDVTF